MCDLLRKVVTIGVNLCKTPNVYTGHLCAVSRIPSYALPVARLCVQADEKNVMTNTTSEEPDILYQRLEIEVRGHDPAVLKSYEWFACRAAKELDIGISRTWVPPKHLMRRDALKSAFVHKKHQVQYEFRTYFRVFELKHLTGSTADTYLEYIQRNLPEGVAMKVTRKALERLPEHIRHPPGSTNESIVSNQDC